MRAWIERDPVTVINEDRPDDVIARVRTALASRGWPPGSFAGSLEDTA